MIAALLDHLWQSTLFAACVAALALLVRRQAARLRFALWLAASLKFLLPFSALVLLGRWLLPPVLVPGPVLAALKPAALPFSAGPIVIIVLSSRWSASFTSLSVAPTTTTLCGGPATATARSRKGSSRFSYC